MRAPAVLACSSSHLLSNANECVVFVCATHMQTALTASRGSSKIAPLATLADFKVQKENTTHGG